MSQKTNLDRRTLTVIIIFMGTFIGHQAWSAESIEFMCRSKAKEIAAETYKNCVVDNKQAEIDRIRQEYKDKLDALKNQYNQELKGLSSEEKATQSVPEGAAVSSAKNNVAARKATSPKKSDKKAKISSKTVVTTTAELIEEDVKKVDRSPKVKIEKIDFSKAEDDSSVEVSRLVRPNTEIVEIPYQEE